MEPRDASIDDPLARACRERDLYLRLLSLGEQTEPETFLREALALVVELTSAERGYLELNDPLDDGLSAHWWAGHGCSDEEIADIRSSISSGIMAEALATGETIVTQSALLDERFKERRSVQLHRIEAVLCAPIGGDAGVGVLYLQGRESPGPFSKQDRSHAEIFAQHVAPLAERVLLRHRMADEVDAMRALRERHALEGLVGRSQSLAAAVGQAMLAAPLDVNLFLTGESGTGKSQLAHLVHVNSPRATAPFVELNCAALPQQLIESELFGALAGSHSEARKDKPGKVAAAEGGTLFLDEVGEIPLESQAKLLQLLQARRYYPLGATQPVEADIRLIAATNRDLDTEVAEGRFRQDLFYRLQVLPVRMPSLRERREDLRELSRSLLDRVCARYQLRALALSAPALHAITTADWPGNVRQLENAIEAAAIRAHGEASQSVEVRHVFVERRGAPGSEEAEPLTYEQETRRFQRALLERVLEETGWNVAETARRLELARSHVYNLIRAFDLARPRGS